MEIDILKDLEPQKVVETLAAMAKEQGLPLVQALGRPELMKIAKVCDVADINHKTNEVLAEMITAKIWQAGGGGPDEEAPMLTKADILDALDQHLRDDGNQDVSLEDQFTSLWRQARGYGACEIDIAFHEDLDELEAFESNFVGEQAPIVRVNLAGNRGVGRKLIQGKVKRAMEQLGFKVRYMGITIGL